MIPRAGEGLAWVQGYSMCTRAYVHRLYSMKDKARHYTIAQLSIKPAMLVSSVQAVVACCVTVPRVFTLVLFIFCYPHKAVSSNLTKKLRYVHALLKKGCRDEVTCVLPAHCHPSSDACCIEKGM